MLINFLKIFHSKYLMFHNISYFILGIRFYTKILVFIFLIHMVLWTLYKGECITSYYYKKKKDKNYELGSNVYDTSDYYLNKDNLENLKNNNKFEYYCITILNNFFKIIKIYFLYLTNLDLNTILLSISLYIFAKTEKVSAYIYSKRIRYILLILFYTLITNKKLLKEKNINCAFLIICLFLIFLILFNHYKLKKNKEKNINEITVIGLLFYLLITYKILTNIL